MLPRLANTLGIVVVLALAATAGARAQAPRPGVLPGMEVPPAAEPTQPGLALAATVLCPQVVTIAAPQVGCTLTVSGFRPGQPLAIAIPVAMDDRVNTLNGLQVIGLAGTLDPAAWTSPHEIPFQLYACQRESADPTTNCNTGYVAEPGLELMQIVVTQGSSRAEAELEIAVAGSIEDATDTYMIGSVIDVGSFLFASDGKPSVGEVMLSYNSAKWYILPVAAAAERRAMLCNVDDPLLCLVARNGTVGLDAVGADDPAGHWLADDLDGPIFRLHSAAQPELYLRRSDDGGVTMAALDDADTAQQWWVLH